LAHELRAHAVEEVESFNLERKERFMMVHRGDGSERHGWLLRRLSQVTGLALGIAMLGTIGLSGALAQDEDVVAGTDAESLVNAIIQQVFSEIFGDAVVDDDAAVSGGGDINVGGSTGSTVTMGDGGGGSVNMGGGTSGGVTVSDDYGG
jgi:hypothetical protein